MLCNMQLLHPYSMISIHIQWSDLLTYCCSTLSLVLCGISVFWLMFSPPQTNDANNSCLLLSMSAWKISCLRHFIHAHDFVSVTGETTYLYVLLNLLSYSLAMDVQHADISVSKYVSYYGVVSHHYIIISDNYQGMLIGWVRNQLSESVEDLFFH